MDTSGAIHSYIRPNTHIVLRLPSGLSKIVEIQPNTTISIGKFGAFPANLLLGRPYYLTFELSDPEDGLLSTELRVVSPAELHAEALSSNHATPAESRAETADDTGGVEFDIVGENGEVLMRSNRLTVDDPTRQALSMEEIEELKRAGTGSGKDIVAKIMASHQALGEKTSFSLAKYTLRKTKKYMKRFTVLPLDVSMLAQILLEREAPRIMELREEMLGLIGAWANVHYSGATRDFTNGSGVGRIGGGRWLVVDETGGLVVAALAEKMGILYPEEEDEEEGEEAQPEQAISTEAHPSEARPVEPALTADAPSPPAPSSDQPMPDAPPTSNPLSTSDPPPPSPSHPRRPHPTTFPPAMSASTNTLTLLHTHAQPNLSLLRYFSYDASLTSPPTTTHPLHTHLKTLSWLQLLHPSDDAAYAEPPLVPEAELATWKAGKRGTYYRKRRRWERVKRVVDETRAGGFDGLVVASSLDPVGVLRACVPLLRGAGQVVVYSPVVEPLVRVMDLYSRERRTAWVVRQQQQGQQKGKEQGSGAGDGGASAVEGKKIKREAVNGTEDLETEEEDEGFPVNPTLLLSPMLQTTRVRTWQVLPGRTHPLMTGRGGAEGYLFTATRVFPVEGKVEARGKFSKKRKVEPTNGVS
ncbi:tRNA (adenine(58)-N(1))-methyltransferase non-catalytic subunit trm6 [Coniosporium apollinis]|uniref:tRNA (adenine(58)-N(1))-methyltransferase non-catalytic subunit TRM6 n=1 Tax=Coniosporium apollinis TaxID=61459 RepID=A0ABQ9NRG9_9PEZI|nr:tRNA (adenine(58)-N(1))-methyltransferase non-catalytic subunit trm6 [Coniosporium apollinis]